MRLRLLKPLRTVEGFRLPKGTVIEGGRLVARIADGIYGESVDEPKRETEPVVENPEPASEQEAGEEPGD